MSDLLDEWQRFGARALGTLTAMSERLDQLEKAQVRDGSMPEGMRKRLVVVLNSARFAPSMLGMFTRDEWTRERDALLRALDVPDAPS